jgi:predicted AlkP superfamily pyrophosphatase or phosphodiesterase
MSHKTIMILLDGCCYDTATENLGYLEHLVSIGKGTKLRVLGELPSLSRPMYETLMTGLPVDEHGITNNHLIRCSNQISIFDLCKNYKMTTAASAYHWISELYVRAPFQPLMDRVQLKAVSKIQHGIYYFEDQYPDSHVYSDAEFLRQQFEPDFLLVHPMNIDDAGHKYGSTSSEYHQSVAIENILLSTVLPIWMNAGYQIMVTADHGMNEHHLHGGNSEQQRMVPLYLFSDKFVKGIHTDQCLSELFIAPLLCKMLKMEPAPGMRPLSQMEVQIIDV